MTVRTLAAFFMASVALAEPLDDGKDHSAELAKAMEAAVGASKEVRAGFLKSLVLPESAAWFRQAFGEAAGARAATAYEPMAKEIQNLAGFFEEAARQGATKANVTRLAEAPKDPQNDKAGVGPIFAVMKERFALYGVIMVRPDGKKLDGTLDIGFFVWAAGAPRLVGPCEGAAISPIECKNQLKTLGLQLHNFRGKFSIYPADLERLEEFCKDDPVMKLDKRKKFTRFCPCFPDADIPWGYVLPMLIGSAETGSLRFYCPHSHGGLRHVLIAPSTVRELPEAEFQNLLLAQYQESLKLLPKARENARYRWELKSDEAKKAAEDYLKALDAFEAEAKAAAAKK